MPYSTTDDHTDVKPSEPDGDLVARLRKVAEWDKGRQFPGPGYHVLLDEAADHIAAAHDVIRRLRTGWEPMPFASDVRWCREGPTEDRPDLVRSWEPMTEAERAVIEATKEARS